MKKLFVLTAIFALVLAGCDDDPDSDVKGTWIGHYGMDDKGVITLEIGGYNGYMWDGSWVLTFKDPGGTMASYNGGWDRTGNTLMFSISNNKASLSGGKLILTQDLSTTNSRPHTSELTRK